MKFQRPHKVRVFLAQALAVTAGTTGPRGRLRRRRRACPEAIEDIGIIPLFEGVLIHDCWAAYMGYDQCRHQLCGSHLLREMTFVVESDGDRWRD